MRMRRASEQQQWQEMSFQSRFARCRVPGDAAITVARDPQEHALAVLRCAKAPPDVHMVNVILHTD